jgi:hypothetical protein
MARKSLSNSDRFLITLISLTCRRFKPDPVTVSAYQLKLKGWCLSEDQWMDAADSIVGA